MDEVCGTLIEAAPRLLAVLPPSLGSYAPGRLQHMRVNVRTGASVERIEPGALQLGGGEVIHAETIVWAAGVGGPTGIADWGLPVGPAGKIAVNERLQVEGRPEVYAAGDAAVIPGGEGPKPVPMVATAAIQQGQTAARKIMRQIEGQEPEPFTFADPGTLAVIGRNAAAALVFGNSFTGIVAWLLWLGVHIAKLIGFRNWFVVLPSWAWEYVFLDRVARLVLPTRRPPSAGSKS